MCKHLRRLHVRVDAVRIDLDAQDIRQCQALANERIRKYGREHRPYNGTLTPEKLIRINRLGVMGELAVAAYLDVPYNWECNYTPTSKDDDVHGIQVRATDYGNGHLITHSDDLYAPYVLVTLAITGHMRVTASLQGWAPLDECNIAEHWRTDIPYPAYMTPQTALHPMTTLTIKAGST